MCCDTHDTHGQNARIDRDILHQLDEIAAEMQCARSVLIAQAVRDFVENEYPRCAVRQGRMALTPVDISPTGPL